MSLASLTEPGYGLAEAARICGVSKPTVRRRKEALMRAGAVADDAGWHIPAAALVAVGLLAGDAPAPVVRGLRPVSPLPVRPVSAVPVDAATTRIAELEDELGRLRGELAAAQARAEERDRCLRVLEAALAAAPPSTAGREGTVGHGPWRAPHAWTHPTAP